MSKAIIPAGQIAQSIYLLRGQKVLLDFDLAALYEVSTGHLNRAVKRNAARFPGDFMFQLSAKETRNLKCQFGISSWGGRRKFTELEDRAGKHDEKIDASLDAIRQLMAPPEKPRREIGFHVRETAPRYGTRKRR
jgi:ORF6N domain